MIYGHDSLILFLESIFSITTLHIHKYSSHNLFRTAMAKQVFKVGVLRKFYTDWDILVISSFQPSYLVLPPFFVHTGSTDDLHFEENSVLEAYELTGDQIFRLLDTCSATDGCKFRRQKITKLQ